MSNLAKRRAIAFIRALLRESGTSASSASILQKFVLQDDAAAIAAKYTDGKSVLGLSSEGIDALDRLAKNYAALYDLRRDTQSAFESLDISLGEVRDLMASNTVNSSLVTADQLETNRLFWPAFIQALAYIVACLYGTRPLACLRNVALAGSTDLQELRTAADTVYKQIEGLEELGCWTIRRERGRTTPYLSGKTRFVFDWQTVNLETLSLIYELKPLSYGLLSAKDPRGLVVLAGRVYLVGTTVTNSLKLSDQNVHTTLPIGAFSAMGVGLVEPTDPRPALRRYYHDNAYCLHPEQVADALNHFIEVKEGML